MATRYNVFICTCSVFVCAYVVMHSCCNQNGNLVCLVHAWGFVVVEKIFGSKRPGYDAHQVFITICIFSPQHANCKAYVLHFYVELHVIMP